MTATSRNVPVPQEQLDAWARFANQVRVDVFPIQLQIARREYKAADESLTQLHLDAAAALTSMREAGATRPNAAMSPEPVSLELLDTSANRRLAYYLRMAVEAAQEVDRERGQFTEEDAFDGPSTLPIAELLAKVEGEISGPVGLDL